MIIKLLKLNGSKRKLNNPFPPCLTITLRQSLVKSILQHTQLIRSVAVFLRLYVNYSVSEVSSYANQFSLVEPTFMHKRF